VFDGSDPTDPATAAATSGAAGCPDAPMLSAIADDFDTFLIQLTASSEEIRSELAGDASRRPGQTRRWKGGANSP